jgi:molybdate-binding protein/DNA-binding XRE family transcriptional regulator
MQPRQGQEVRRLRLTAGWTQTELARRAQISRQAVVAIEAGTYQPGVAVALRLARLLGTSVEQLFGDEANDEPPLIDAHWIDDAPDSAGAGVAVARVGGKVVAVRMPATQLRLNASGGRVARVKRHHAAVASFRSPEQINSTLLIAGCDPAAALIADWFARERRVESVVVLSQSSTAALTALSAGQIHVAGVHLRDAHADNNLTPVTRLLGRRQTAILVHFAEWELGLAIAANNPIGVKGLADLERKGIRLINREQGAAARMMLDNALSELGLDANRIVGYCDEAPGHLAVAATIAAGRADLGLTLRMAADAYELHFIPLREERYELVIPESELPTAPVKALLATLNSGRFGREVRRLCSYDTTRMGEIVAHIG